MAKVALLLGLLLSAFVIANTALADDVGSGKMSWALKEEVLRWETLGPAATQTVSLVIHISAVTSNDQIRKIEETGADVVGHMLNQVVVEVSSPATVRALAALDFVDYMEFVVPFTGGPVPIVLAQGVQTPSSLKEEKEFIKSRLKTNEALIIYNVRDTNLSIQVIDPKQIHPPTVVAITKRDLTDKIAGLYVTLQTPTGESDAREALKDLYGLLIQPIQAKLKDKDTLIIVPEGVLWHVPFSALIARGEAFLGPWSHPWYLVEDYTISCLPSLEAATLFLGQEPTRTTGGFLGIFSRDPNWYGKETEQSLKWFSRCLVGQAGSYIIAAAEVFTETDFKEQAQRASLIALFAPATFDPLDPQKSYISFVESKEDDGMLQVQEVAALKLTDVDLVILGTAEPLPKALQLESLSDAGEQLASTGAGAVLVWPQAFLTAGANSVIQPLWPANPGAIEKLLVSMCEYHKKGDTWARALAEAQRDLIEDSTFSDPWFWAPYQLIGRWR